MSEPAARQPARNLYTPEILAAATTLAAFPLDPSLSLRGEARSRSCGSSIVLGMTCNADGKISHLGVLPHACAIGQAAASIFVGAAIGANAHDIAKARAAIAHWLSGGTNVPAWPGIA